MSESIVRKIQPFTIGTKLSSPVGPKCPHLTDDFVPCRTLDNYKLQRSLNEQVSLRSSVQAQERTADRHRAAEDTAEQLCQEEMVREDHLNRNAVSPTAASRSIRKITICSSMERVVLRAQPTVKINPNTENLNNNNNITTTSTQLPRIVGVSCENKPHSHFKVLLRKEEQHSSNEQTNGLLLNREKCSDAQQMPVLKSPTPIKDLVKGKSTSCNHREVSMVSKVSVQKDYCFTQQNALFNKELSQAEAWIQAMMKKLRDSSSMQICSLADWEEMSQTLQRDLKDFENTLIQLNQMGEQLMCKLNPTSDVVRKQLSQLKDQWSMLKQTAATQTKVMHGARSLQEFNKKVDQLEAWIKQKEEEQSLASLLGENIDKLQLTRRILDLKQDEQLYRNLHEEINHLALRLEKQAKSEGKNISTRRKHINKMWLKVQSHLKNCQENLQLALEVSSFYQMADNIICSINNMRKCLSDRVDLSGDGEMRDIASQIMELDVTVSQLSNLHPVLAVSVTQKQAEVKDSWLLLQTSIRNEKAIQSPLATREDTDVSKSVGTDPHRIMGKEVKEEQNRLRGITGGRSSDSTRKAPESQQEFKPNLPETLGWICASDVSSRFQEQGKSRTPPKTSSHPQLQVQLQKFTVSADKTLFWLKDSVTMAAHVCSGIGGPGSFEIAKRYQASLEQDIMSNKARIELVKKEGYSLVRAQHPGSAKIQEFLSQLEILWEELKRRHQRNGMVLQASEELSYRAVRVLQALGSLEAWLEAVELSIRQASLAGDPESVSVVERESCLLETELETRGLELHNLRQEVEALCSQRNLHTQLLPTRMEEVEKKFSSVQMALTQQSSKLNDTRMLTEFLERLELEESHYGTLGQPLQSDLNGAPSSLPLAGARHSECVMKSLGDPVEELREAVEMLNDTARERGRSQSHDHSIQELLSKHSIVAMRVEQCLQRCAELAVDVLEMEREMAVRCEPERCGLVSLQEQQNQLEIDYKALKVEVETMESLSTQLANLCPERVHALGSEIQTSLQAWEELGKSMAENQSRLLQFGHLRNFFRNYLAMISWTEDTRSRIFSESALRQNRENQGSMIELLDQQIEQKFQEFDLLAAAVKKLLNEEHHLAKMIKERMEELRSMLGWILVHWRAQKRQWLNRKGAEEQQNDVIYSEATLVPQFEPETSSDDQQKRTEVSAIGPSDDVEDTVQQDNGYEVMKSISPDSETQHMGDECDSPYLVLKEPSTPSLGGTVNLVLSFTNSGESQLQKQEPDQMKTEESSEAVHRPSEPHYSVCKSFWKRCQGLFGSLKRKKKVYQHSTEEVSAYLHVKDNMPAVAPVYESMTLPLQHSMAHSPASFSPCASLCSSSSPEVDSASLNLPSRNSTSSIFSSLVRKSKKRKKKKDVRSHTVQKIMGVEPSDEVSSSPVFEPVTYNMHTWPLKEKKKRKSRGKSETKENTCLDYVKNPLVKDIDAECTEGLISPVPNMLEEKTTTAHVKHHCRFLSLGSVLSFDLPKDISLIPSIQDIITIGPVDSRNTMAQLKDSCKESSIALSTFKLARSQPAPKDEEPKNSPGEITLIDCQDDQIDAISVSHKEPPTIPVPHEDILVQESQTSSLTDLTSIQLKLFSGISNLHKDGFEMDQLAAHLNFSNHHFIDPPTLIKASPNNEESISVTTNSHICPSVHTLIQNLDGHQYHKTKSICSQPRIDSPIIAQNHTSHIVLNFKANGREDSVDSGHSSSGSFKLCTEAPYLDTSENPAPRRAVGKLLSLELGEPHRNLKTEPVSSPVDDPVHPDHEQFEQEEEELEDIWNQTNGYRQSICSDIMYQGLQTEPTNSSPDPQRQHSPKETAVLVKKLITASAPNLLVTDFQRPSSNHNLIGYSKDWSTRDETQIMAKGERRSWAAFPQKLLINETASDPVKLPELADQKKYIYQYREAEEEEEEEKGDDTGQIKDHSLNLLSVYVDREGSATESDNQVLNPSTGMQKSSSLMSGRQDFPSMEGTLERKHKLLLGGRRAPCRVWSSYHAVLYRQTLCFYQDRKDTMRSSVTSLPLNLNGAECIPAPEYTKKPNCFSLRLCDGSEYLLSASSRFMMKKWILRIQENAESSESEVNISASCGSMAQEVAFSRGISSSARCQCTAVCQCSAKGDDHLILTSCSQPCSPLHCEKPEMSVDKGQCDSLGVVLKQQLHSQSPNGLPFSLSFSEDFSDSKRRSHSFTSATYQRIKPIRLPPSDRVQDSSSSYSVTVFIGDREKTSVNSSAAFLQPSCRQQSFSELPLRSYASLPRPNNKSVFRKFFRKKD